MSRTLSEKVLQRNDIIKNLQEDFRVLQGKQLKHYEQITQYREEISSMLHRMDGLQIQDEAIRADNEAIKDKQMQLQYLERDLELSLKSHEGILKQT